MAYKNKKKNAKHQAEIRKQNSYKKHERKRRMRELKYPHKEMTAEDYEILLRQEGLI